MLAPVLRGLHPTAWQGLDDRLMKFLFELELFEDEVGHGVPFLAEKGAAAKPDVRQLK